MSLPADPYSFTDGATADADEVNARFLPLYTALSAGGLDAEALASQAWTAWTPTITTIAGASNTIVARSMKLGRTVHVQGQISLGSGGSFSGSDVTVSLPYAAASTMAQVGKAFAVDGATYFYGGVCIVASGASVLKFRLDNGSGHLAMTGAVPFTWGNGDVLNFEITYEAAS